MLQKTIYFSFLPNSPYFVNGCEKLLLPLSHPSLFSIWRFDVIVVHVLVLNMYVIFTTANQLWYNVNLSVI
jgi:hypothetical protein